MNNTFLLSLFGAVVLGLAPVASANNGGNNGCNPGSGGGYGGGNNGCNNGGNNGGYGNGGYGGNNGCNVNLTCDAGGPYSVAGIPGVVTLVLDGTDSRYATGYSWSTSFPGAGFLDGNTARPTLTIPVADECGFTLTVQLTVTRGNQSKSCSTTVRVRDAVKPVIVCPPDSKLTCGEDESPETHGRATATDNCDPNVQISYTDKIFPGVCAAERFDHRIERTWKARDNDCNTSKCVQNLDVVKEVTFLDVLPGVCPNLYDRNACNQLSVAILGLDSFDVTKIQWNTVKMWGKHCDGGPVSASGFHLADVASPFIGGAECDCHDLNGDGKLDLVVRFSRSQINCAFQLGSVPVGTAIPVVVTGRLCDGCKFIAQDCIVVK